MSTENLTETIDARIREKEARDWIDKHALKQPDPRADSLFGQQHARQEAARLERRAAADAEQARLIAERDARRENAIRELPKAQAALAKLDERDRSKREKATRELENAEAALAKLDEQRDPLIARVRKLKEAAR